MSVSSWVSKVDLHLGAAVLVIFLDCLWLVPELAAPLLGSLALFPIAAAIVFVAQRFIEDDSMSRSLAKGLIAGVLVAIPFPVFGFLLVVPGLAKKYFLED